MGLSAWTFQEAFDAPVLYRLGQRLLAPGAGRVIAREIEGCLGSIPTGARLLDVGCGPASWLWRLGYSPVGIDLSPARIAAFRRGGGAGLVASATSFPFADASFDAVVCVGLFHHLPEEEARPAVSEMLRVTRPGGRVLIVDGVPPESPWRRPAAWMLRRLDLGRWMRQQRDLESLLGAEGTWQVERIAYAWTGLEAVLCSAHRR